MDKSQGTGTSATEMWPGYLAAVDGKVLLERCVVSRVREVPREASEEFR